MQPKHEKVTTFTKQPDESIKIEQKSYYEKLAHEVVEIEKPVVTSFYTLKKDVDRALDHVTEDGSSQLVLTIKVNKGKPTLIKRWLILKKDYPRK